MTRRIRSLVIALRVAYAASLGCFVLAVVLAFAAAVTTVSENAGAVQLVFELPDDSPAMLPIDWLALLAFAFAALGAVLTVLARVSAPAELLDEH
ncbi:hypothetical protein [Herbiconiux flava]|uniref:Transmembrane protein n=1 Tax=Herbiconiux flava TaxID=881268 RepID=A0A852SR34_9MICO|nr:hypothetical protein [Herbiconiux flava]NYD71329.1 hypothetical protein [Herbiconiux flava]GLK18707.1 hypothetical protein GCM10017602_31890 [Herbiconiux flava]